MTKERGAEAVQVVTAWLEARGQAEFAGRLWAVAGLGACHAVPIPVDVEHVIDEVDELLTRLGQEDLATDVAVATEPHAAEPGQADVLPEVRPSQADDVQVMRQVLPRRPRGRAEKR